MSRRCADDAGRELSFAAAPRRIVSLVPSLTEVVCALGAAERLVGVTRYCTDPPHVVARVARVGGTKNPDIAAIVALRPDLVLVNSEENRRADFAVLEDLGLPVFVSYPRTVAAAAQSIARIAVALDLEAAGSALQEEIEGALAEPTAGRRRVFCPIWRNPWMAFNADTFAHDLLARAGGDNVCADLAPRYPSIDLVQIVAHEPEIVLLPDEPYRFSRRDLPALAPLRDTPAGRAGRILFVDGKALSWYGPRTAAALRMFRRMIAG